MDCRAYMRMLFGLTLVMVLSCQAIVEDYPIAKERDAGTDTFPDSDTDIDTDTDTDTDTDMESGSDASTMTGEETVYEAGRCLHCNLRLCISEALLPPEKWLALTAESVACVPEGEGVYILLDESGKPIKIKGTQNLRSDLQTELDSAAKFFEFEKDKMYSKRESELLQQHLQKYGEMPSGGEDELDDLF